MTCSSSKASSILKNHEDWTSVLWIDETWVEDGRQSREWATRNTFQEYNADFVGEKLKNRVSWVFTGCFAGPEKGPYLFWEREWGSINSQKYCEKIVPLVNGMVSMRPWLSVVQDNAPARTAASTM
ncbi:Bgt-50923 [Blumeria graminis f. sp. tritici]|uniref:Bgt-50923 n=1 Tax=Blumeria graminis f. sp. tritici TaxID=62690 RepID=A0A9X9L8N4_BLUGR|nr:Bgt-50923 [Blumeria graminis f. sp. tritici]